MISKILCILTLGALLWSTFAIIDHIHPVERLPDKLIISTTTVPAEHTLRVLFLGNSYTDENKLPRMFADIASSDPQNRIRFEIGAVLRGGAHTINLLKEGQASTLLKSQHWDYVVLQDQSEWALFDDYIQAAHYAGAKFAEATKQAGGRLVLYQTWMRRPGSDWYTDWKTADAYKSPDYMQSRFHDETHKLAGSLGASIVPVGDFWAQALHDKPGMNLYQKDGSHPGPEGTYLAALLFYRTLSGNSVQNITYMPPNSDPSEVKMLRDMVVRYYK